MSDEQGVSWRRFLAGWRVRSAIALLLGVTLVAVVALQYVRAGREQEAYSYLLRTNRWVASQLQLELLRFLRSVDDFVIGAPQTSHDDVMLRFDLLWSRVPVFLHGPEAAVAREVEGSVDTVERLLADLAALEPLVAGLGPGDLEARTQIVARLGQYHESLQAITLEVAIGERRRELLGRMEAVARRDLGLALAVLTGALLLVLFLLTEIARSRHQAEREREARKAAMDANQAKSRFLANMSHELRTPLNAIIGFSEVMHEERLGPIGTPRYHDYAGDIMASGRHLLAILNDVLDAARIEAGTIRLVEETFDPCEMVRSTLRILKPMAEAKGISLVESLDTAVPLLFADARLFRQICLNLVGNSLKFSPHGAQVNVACAWREDHVSLVVEDNGPGIAADEVDRVLEPFYQSDSELHRNHEGCGLGLALAKAFTELHGGCLEISSRVGFGTCISVKFPDARNRLRSADVA